MHLLAKYRKIISKKILIKVCFSNAHSLTRTLYLSPKICFSKWDSFYQNPKILIEHPFYNSGVASCSNFYDDVSNTILYDDHLRASKL